MTACAPARCQAASRSSRSPLARRGPWSPRGPRRRAAAAGVPTRSHMTRTAMNVPGDRPGSATTSRRARRESATTVGSGGEFVADDHGVGGLQRRGRSPPAHGDAGVRRRPSGGRVVDAVADEQRPCGPAVLQLPYGGDLVLGQQARAYVGDPDGGRPPGRRRPRLSPVSRTGAAAGQRGEARRPRRRRPGGAGRRGRARPTGRSVGDHDDDRRCRRPPAGSTAADRPPGTPSSRPASRPRRRSRRPWRARPGPAGP